MIKGLFIVFNILCFIENCICQCNNCGIVIFKMEVFDSIQKKFVHGKGIPDKKIYYKDSIVIMPSTALISNEVNGVEISYEEKDIYYTYINLKAKKVKGVTLYNSDSTFFSTYNATFYEYPAFSKDSCFTKKYINLDTAIFRTWAFFLERSSHGKTKTTDSIPLIKETNASTTLPDTVVGGVYFHREKHTYHDKDRRVASIAIPYYRCDVQDWMLMFVKEKNDKGCIVPRIDFTVLNSQTNQLKWVSQQYEFLPRKLTREEIEVFDAWEKNEKKYPVSR